MRRQAVRHDAAYGDGPVAVLRLRRRQHRWSLPGGPQLLVDPQLPAQGVDPVDRQAEQLALPQPGACRNQQAALMCSGAPAAKARTSSPVSGTNGGRSTWGSRAPDTGLDANRPSSTADANSALSVCATAATTTASAEPACPPLDVLPPHSHQRPVASFGRMCAAAALVPLGLASLHPDRRHAVHSAA